MTLEQRIDTQVTRALNVCKTPDGFQASLERRPGVFSIRVEPTASAAIAAVLGALAESDGQIDLPLEQAGSVFD